MKPTAAKYEHRRDYVAEAAAESDANLAAVIAKLKAALMDPESNKGRRSAAQGLRARAGLAGQAPGRPQGRARRLQESHRRAEGGEAVIHKTRIPWPVGACGWTRSPYPGKTNWIPVSVIRRYVGTDLRDVVTISGNRFSVRIADLQQVNPDMSATAAIGSVQREVCP